MQQQHREQMPRPPRHRLPDDRDEPIDEPRTHTRHPNDDRLTEADLDEHERKRRAAHPRTRNAR